MTGFCVVTSVKTRKGKWAAVAVVFWDLGLIDEYEFLVQPRIVDHGPTQLRGERSRSIYASLAEWSLPPAPWRCGTSREGSEAQRFCFGACADAKTPAS